MELVQASLSIPLDTDDSESAPPSHNAEVCQQSDADDSSDSHCDTDVKDWKHHHGHRVDGACSTNIDSPIQFSECLGLRQLLVEDVACRNPGLDYQNTETERIRQVLVNHQTPSLLVQVCKVPTVDKSPTLPILIRTRYVHGCALA